MARDRPPPDEEETRFLPPRDDEWDEEERVVRRRPPGPVPRRRTYAEDDRRYAPPPPPPGRTLWPWLLLLLGLVLGGLAAAYYFTREDEPERRPVPAVVRLTERDATERLEEEGFDVGVERGESDAPVGIVFAQTPGAGRTLEEGDTVVIHVSEGPPPSTVPNLVGLPEAQARQRLEQAELEVSREEVFSEEPPGIVVAQDPAAGEEVERGTSVRINVSRGSGRVEVADVVGLLVDEAREALAEQDLEANVVQVPSREPEGTVVAQNPPGGRQATRGDTVRLNVSRGS